MDWIRVMAAGLRLLATRCLIYYYGGIPDRLFLSIRYWFAGEINARWRVLTLFLSKVGGAPVLWGERVKY